MESSCNGSSNTEARKFSSASFAAGLPVDALFASLVYFFFAREILPFTDPVLALIVLTGESRRCFTDSGSPTEFTKSKTNLLVNILTSKPRHLVSVTRLRNSYTAFYIRSVKLVFRYCCHAQYERLTAYKAMNKWKLDNAVAAE